MINPAIVTQYSNRLCEWFDTPRDIVRATYVFIDLLEQGYTLDDAFRLVVESWRKSPWSV